MKGRARLLAGFVDQGGTAIVVAGEGHTPSRALVSGRINDSTIAGGTPDGLAGAIIRVRGQADSAVSDRDGTFSFALGTGGEQVIEVEHPKLGLVPAVTTRRVLLSLGDSLRVDFSTPGIATYAGTFCGTQAGRARSGLMGMTFAPSGIAKEGMTVRILWEAAPGVSREELSESGPDGIYVLCDLPAERPLQVHFHDGAVPISTVTVTLGRGEYRWVDVKP